MNIIINFLPENIPSKKNSKQIFWNKKTNKPFITSQNNFKEWNKRNVIFCKSQYKGNPIEKCNNIILGITFYTNHKKDLTNVAESMMDCLVEAGILKDDCWQVTGEISLNPFWFGNSYAEIYY